MEDYECFDRMLKLHTTNLPVNSPSSQHERRIKVARSCLFLSKEARLPRAEINATVYNFGIILRFDTMFRCHYTLCRCL